MMKKVLKFGGSSVAGEDQIRRVVDIVINQPTPVVVVVSALGGVTDQLKDLAEQTLKGDFDSVISALELRHVQVINALLSGQERDQVLEFFEERVAELRIICQGISMIQELSVRSVARLMSFGELISSIIVTAAIRSKGVDAERWDSRKLILTSGDLLKGEVDNDETYRRMRAEAASLTGIAVAPGFIASTKNGVTSTLGRGGSDYTAALFAAALEVDQLEIWSDVNGMLTSNPKMVSAARTIPHLSYNEAFELSHFGAKVLYPPAIQPAYEKGIPLTLKNTFEPAHTGTIIDREGASSDDAVSGIASIDRVAMVNLTGIGMVGVPGYSSRVFAALHEYGVNVVMIAQSCSERGICIVVDIDDLEQTHEALKTTFKYEIESGRVDPITLEDNLSVIAVVGDGMKYRIGVSGRMFSVLGQYGINIRAIAQGSSESNVSIIVDSEDEIYALRELHRVFFENKPIQLNLFIVGIGTVGSSFIDLLIRHKQDLIENNNLEINICGLANSRKMILRANGVEPEIALQELEKSERVSDLSIIYGFADALNKPNKIFVDNTATESTAPFYRQMLTSGIHVVTCNKIVASGSLDIFKDLQNISEKGPARFHYETNVGAALPMVQTVQQLRRSGDKIHRIEAILSGSLGYIFNEYDGSISFAEVVKKARDLGYTEPDPLIDLSGVDVKRKLVILARNAGLQMSVEDVGGIPFLPEVCYKASNPQELFDRLEENENHFQEIIESAKKENKKLKYIGQLMGGKLSVSVQKIDGSHPFYSLQGSDNIAAFYTTRYKSPLVISGAGAGPELTASGVLNDVLRIDFSR